MPGGRSGEHYLAMLAKQRTKDGPFAPLGRAARDFMASEHRANLHMSAQLKAAPTYAKAHGRPENVWADWAQATGSHASRGAGFVGRRGKKAVLGMFR